MNLDKPTNMTATDVLVKRSSDVARHREQQPAYNQPTQDTLPGASSNDS